jgi:hypothetical protein
MRGQLSLTDFTNTACASLQLLCENAHSLLLKFGTTHDVRMRAARRNGSRHCRRTLSSFWAAGWSELVRGGSNTRCNPAPFHGLTVTTTTDGSITRMMQARHYRCGSETVDSEEIPASTLKPSAKPPQRKKASKKRKNCTHYAREHGGSQVGGSTDVLCLDKAHHFTEDNRRS